MIGLYGEWIHMPRYARIVALICLALALGRPLWACPPLIGSKILNWSPVSVDGLTLAITPEALQATRGRPLRMGAGIDREDWKYATTSVRFSRADNGSNYHAYMIAGQELTQANHVVLRSGDFREKAVQVLGKTDVSRSDAMLWRAPSLSQRREHDDNFSEEDALIVNCDAGRVSGCRLYRGFVMNL